MFRDPAVLSLLGRQHWVATPSQLRSLGLSETALQRAIRTRILERPARDVVRLAGAPDTYETRAMQLVLMGEPDGYLSGPTAARSWGVRGSAEHPIELTITHTQRIVVPPWARLVRSSWLEPDLHRRTLDNGLVVSSPLRTLMRLGELYGGGNYGRTKFEKAAEDLWHRRLIEPAAAAQFLASVRRSGRGGVAVFEEWLGLALGRDRASQSHSEVAFAAMLRLYGLPDPQRQFPVTIEPGVTIHVDLAYPDIRLAIEPGASWWHGGDERARADDRRDRAMTELGWATMRFDEVELADLESCVRQVARTYRRRADERSRAQRSAS